MKLFDSLQTPLGRLYIVFSGKALTGISFDRPANIRPGSLPGRAREQFGDYFEGALREFDLEIRLEEGTDFERKVWLALKEIPYGKTKTYKWLAGRVGIPRGSRAVGQALSKNPLPIVLPCHRIIESDGRLGGYSSGVNIKRRLLALEYYHSGKGP